MTFSCYTHILTPKLTTLHCQCLFVPQFEVKIFVLFLFTIQSSRCISMDSQLFISWVWAEIDLDTYIAANEVR